MVPTLVTQMGNFEDNAVWRDFVAVNSPPDLIREAGVMQHVQRQSEGDRGDVGGIAIKYAKLLQARGNNIAELDIFPLPVHQSGCDDPSIAADLGQKRQREIIDGPIVQGVAEIVWWRLMHNTWGLRTRTNTGNKFA